MCIINDPAVVSRTKILVAPDYHRLSQLTVYSNEVETNTKNNMMLLPVPNPESVQFIDLSDYDDIFTDLEMHFGSRGSRGGGLTKSAFLEVVSVGSYRATLVKTFKDLNNIDPEIFGKVSQNIKDILFNQYHHGNENNFGYIVCKLTGGEKFKYHPFAYTHELVKSGKLFVPTLHVHDGENAKAEEHWDHCIYSINTAKQGGDESRDNRDLYAPSGKYFDKQKISQFDSCSFKVLNKKYLSGLYENKDVEYICI